MIFIVAPRFLSLFTGGFAKAITLWPMIILRSASLKEDVQLVQHERIHGRQQLELGIFIFYIWYVCAYIRWRIKYGKHEAAYRHISFEQEAFSHEGDKDYMETRRIFAFYQYVGSKKVIHSPTKQYLMNKIEHIGIAVKSIKEGNDIYARLLGVGPYKSETVASQKVITSFFQMGESKIELLAATDKESPIAKFLEKRGEGIHHIAFEVQDIEGEMARLREEGFVLLNEKPVPGADNKLICFVHPKSANGVLIELCQSV